MLHNEAVRLFFERAQAVSPDFALTEKTAPIIAQICQRLDGMPLAIELAAARVRVLSLEQIAARLDQRFSLLASGSRTVTARQQTLRATIDWSYALLTEAEQALFRRGSVFVGGWSIEAAEQICRGDPLASGEFLDTLDRLVKKSLVIAEIHGVEARFHMLETIRQYAFERLLESGEEWEIDARHLSFFLGLAEKARPLLSGPEQVAWLNRLEVEHDNLRLALRWALENAQASPGIDPIQRSRLRQEALRLAGSLGDFWYMHGHWSEGRRWLQQALDQNTEDVSSIKAWALVKAGTLAVFQNDYAQAQALLDESFSLFQILGEKHGLGRTLFYLAMIASDQGDNPLSIRYVEESLALEKEVGDREGQAFSLHLLGEILNGLGEPQRAISYFQPSLALFREMGNQWAIALSLVTLGASAYYLGDYAQAAALEQEGLDRWRELGDTRMIAIALYELGRATLGLRDFTKTMAYWKESLQIFKNVGDRDFFNQCLEGLATLACRQRQWKRAARMYAAASAYRQEIGVPVYDADRAQLEQSLSMIKAGIGEEEFKKAWSEGSQMSPEQALEYASQVDETVLQGEQASTSTPLKRAKAQYGGLTAREREVAALIAKGRSNMEIARELYVGLRTVEAHVTAILTKLSFHSRTQIAGWAIDKGLAPPPR